MRLATLALAPALALAVAGPALAQDAPMGHDMPAADLPPLPAICGASPAPAGMAMDHAMDASHAALMSGMAAMNQQMMAGMMAQDVDVAFVCGMIPHHRGAVAMARAELAHGDDPWAKDLAGAIVAAQEKEIAAMLAWLDRQAAK